MNREDVTRMAREAGIKQAIETPHLLMVHELERFAAIVAAAERKTFPDLTAVINWLENGCDPKEAAKELRLYAAAIRARGQA